MKKQIDIENIIKMFSEKSSSKILKEAIKELKPKKEERYIFLLIVIICIIPAALIAYSKNTIVLLGNSIESINGIILAIFGITFTGYTFFQALINKDLLVRLLETLQQKKSMFQISNEYFVNIMMIDVLAIIINVFLLLITKNLPEYFHLPLFLWVNDLLAFICIWIYLTFEILVIWEMKSYVFNIFQLFNAHAGAKYLQLLNNENDEEDE